MYRVIYPSICSLFRQRGRYVCIKRNHCPHLSGVVVPTFRCNAYSRSWVRWCPSAIPCRLASSRLFICCCTSGRLISALMAALSVLILCSTMLRNGLYGGSFLSSVHLLLFISRKYPFICVQICFTMVNICKISLFKRIMLMSDCLLLTLGENTVMFVSPY